MTIETKYNIGDKVWFMHKNRCSLAKVESVRAKKLAFSIPIEINYYLQGIDWFEENLLFPTKEELLKSL